VPRVDIYYHFLPPDDVVSARHFGDLAKGLSERGWTVRLFGSNRSCRATKTSFPLSEFNDGVSYHRVWRPDWPQNRTYGRVGNALWMAASWALRALWETSPPDIMITGTDPIFSVASSLAWKASFPSTQLVHWCFDLYPDALFAEGVIRDKSVAGRCLSSVTKFILEKQNLVANLGPCMANRLARHAPQVDQMELTPWALVEPDSITSPDPKMRAELFGNAQLGLLYSGSFGRAHSFEDILNLARKLRKESIGFCFAVRGNRVEQLKAALLPEDTNIGFAGFALEADLETRLASADIHVASLTSEWTGCVVPSKFFGSLAIGRPVLFAGSTEASPSRWATDHEIGWTLNPATLDSVAQKLIDFGRNPKSQIAMQERCFKTYQTHFSQASNLNRLDSRLRNMLKITTI